MQRFAILDAEGVVVNVAVADKPLGNEWVPATSEVETGDLYDPESKTFSKPEKPEPTPDPSLRIITVGAFRRRLTLNEKVALEVSTDPVVKVLDKDLTASTYVELDLPEFIEGLGYLAANVEPFTPERIETLRADAKEGEFYNGPL
ncbi:MAG: hypothetical protein CMK92_05185 [Pseudomonas sp.]|nr:hypothetical protein [Pseudomonas sp.]